MSNKNITTVQYGKEKYVGIYVHIPFCNLRCFYCNFNSYVINKSDENNVHNSYINAVIREIESYKEKLQNYIVNTIFIGGGTPSILISGGIGVILQSIYKNFTVLENCEVTMEINPNAFAYDNALLWKKAGVNRVSVGLQTANNNILKSIGRTHTKNDFISTMQMLKKAGFNNINCDLILGLPGQTLSDVKDSLKLALMLGVKHISAYSLILEDETVLSKLVKESKVKLPDEQETIKMYDLVYKFLKKRKLYRYEVSNFSRIGYECKHNLNCWNMFYYVGFGAGAHSYFENRRYSIEKNVHSYICLMNEKGSACDYSEDINNQELFEETILLGLRTKAGINLNELKTAVNVDLLNIKKDIISKFLKLKLIKIAKGSLFLNNKGYYVLNKIILELVD